jgi:hypothetical protein
MTYNVLHIVGLLKCNPTTSASHKSFISKCWDINDLISFITLILVPEINISTTYKHIITPSPPPKP